MWGAAHGAYDLLKAISGPSCGDWKQCAVDAALFMYLIPLLIVHNDFVVCTQLVCASRIGAGGCTEDVSLWKVYGFLPWHGNCCMVNAQHP
jgi:hypothetical protein